MAQRKRYRIFCMTEEMWVEGYTNLDTLPTTCPNNPAHTVNANSVTVIETLMVNNLEATTDPTINDDINLGYAINSTWVNTVTQNVFFCVDNTSGAAVWKSATLLSVYVQDLSESSTTSTDYQPKLRLTTSSLPAGVYRAAWYSGVKANASSKIVVARVIIDSDPAQEIGSIESGGNSYIPFSGFSHNTLTAGVHTIDINFKCGMASMTAYIRNARIELWRIS